MTSFKESFVEEFSFNEMGEITGSSGVSRMPSVYGQLFRLQGRSTNTNSFWIGVTSGSMPWEIGSGNDTGWFTFMGDNLENMFYYNSSGSTEVMTYWVQK